MKKFILLFSLVSTFAFGQVPVVDELYIRGDGQIYFNGVAWNPDSSASVDLSQLLVIIDSTIFDKIQADTLILVTGAQRDTITGTSLTTGINYSQFVDSVEKYVPFVEFDGLSSDSIRAKSTGRTALTDYILYPPHFSSNFSDSSVLLSLAADTYQQVTNSQDSLFRVRFESNGLSSDGDTVFLLNEPAHYQYKISLGFSSVSAANTRLALYSDNGLIQSFGVSTTNAAAEEIISFSGIHSTFDGSSKLWLEIKTQTGVDVTLIDGVFNVYFYHKIY